MIAIRNEVRQWQKMTLQGRRLEDAVVTRCRNHPKYYIDFDSNGVPKKPLLAVGYKQLFGKRVFLYVFTWHYGGRYAFLISFALLTCNT
jgi:hypothetical protein